MTPYVWPERTTDDVLHPHSGDLARDPLAPWRVLAWSNGAWHLYALDNARWPARDALPTTDPEDC